MTSSFIDLASTPGALSKVLVNFGLADPGEVPAVTPLTGGISSNISRVTVRTGTYCLKQALPKLKVDKEWVVPIDRVFSEIAWLQLVDRIVPGHVPRVLGVDDEIGAFVMEFLDEHDFPNWKAMLFDGTAPDNTARNVAAILGQIHATTACDPNVARSFSNRGNFYLLRLEPYLVEAAKQHPDLADQLIALIHSVQCHPLVLVHGDISPKNILVGQRAPVFLDAECACFSDPAFDVAFILNHLLLKSLAIPAARVRLEKLFDDFTQEYFRHVNWEDPRKLESRIALLLPGLLLARIDGKSPVEYLSQSQRQKARKVARSLLKGPEQNLSTLNGLWC